MPKYVVRDSIGHYQRGDIIDNPDVVPASILNQHCNRVPDDLGTQPAPPATEKPAAKPQPAGS